jgi:carbamoyl-phosphate synthase large subunit
MKTIVKSILISLLILFTLLISSIILSKVPFFLNLENESDTINILILSNYNGYMLKDIYHNGVCLWAYYILYEFIKKKYKNKSFKLYFKSVKSKTNVKKLIKYIKRYSIKYIIPTESKNSTYLSKYKQQLEKYVNILVPDNPKIIKELDDKYSCYLFCKKHNIPTAETILVNKVNIKNKTVKQFLEKHNYPLFLKKAYDTNGAQDVFQINDYADLKDKVKTIKGRWILQQSLEPNHASIDILYYKGNALSITMHSHKWHTDMRSISSEYFFPTIYSLKTHKSISSKYVTPIMDIVNKLGRSSKYTGIMNVDMLIDNDKPYLLEINPRFSGSIYISMKTSLLKDYFRLLLNKKFSNIQNIDYQKNKINKASEVKDFSIIPFVMENLGIILSVDKLDVDTYAVN